MRKRSYRVGDEVLFTDEFGKERRGKVVRIDGDKLAITIGSYGDYSRYQSEVRPVQNDERRNP